MKITALIDPGVAPRRDPQMLAPWDSAQEPPMDRSVIQALRSNGHEVTVVSFEGDVLAALDRARPELVFNMTEFVDGNRRRSGDVPALLEALGLRYTGAGAIGQVLTIDKAVSKMVVRDLGVAVPGFEVLPIGRTRLRRALAFPVLVKPRYGEGSEGITLRSLAATPADVARLVRLVHDALGQAAICEEFIDGRELAVGILGDRELTAFPVRETAYGTWRTGRARFNTSLLKTSAAFRTRFGICSVKADLPRAAARAVQADCIRIFRALELRDYGRIDLRQDASGRVVFIEANANCDLKPSAFGVIAAWGGITYSQLIETIVQQARRRRADRVPLHQSRPLF